MLVMPANNAKMEVGYLAGKYPGRVGWLLGPNGWKDPKHWLPYALDNGRFIATTQNKEWDEGAFLAMLDKCAGHASPLWVVVPDVVGDRDGTLSEWDKWAPRLERCGYPLAMAVQDGMEATDVPSEAAVVFVGGTTEWKWRTLRTWCKAFPRVHVGRVNGQRGLWICHELGAESCDGTGWFRGDPKQMAGLWRYLDRASRGLMRTDDRQQSLFESDSSGGNSGREVGASLRPADCANAGQGKVA